MVKTSFYFSVIKSGNHTKIINLNFCAFEDDCCREKKEVKHNGVEKVIVHEKGGIKDSYSTEKHYSMTPWFRRTIRPRLVRIVLVL